VSSRVRLAGLALAIRTVAWGGPKADPFGIAPAPLSFRALASRAKLSGANWALNFEHVHRQSFDECIARSAVLDFEAPTSAKASAATTRRVSALKSKACAAPEHPSASSATGRARRPDQRCEDQLGCRRMGGCYVPEHSLGWGVEWGCARKPKE
jgi:hypothetical protein